MYDGVSGTQMGELRATDADMDEFIVEADIMLHDNDGIGFVFGFKHINDHFTVCVSGFSLSHSSPHATLTLPPHGAVRRDQ
jgi:hypothetical protein